MTAALQRFASGDLTPQPIAADDGTSSASLAAAYNGAIEQMERAFDARDRANASMRQFIADAGHQLRTPLTVVQGFHRHPPARRDSRARRTASASSIR